MLRTCSLSQLPELLRFAASPDPDFVYFRFPSPSTAISRTNQMITMTCLNRSHQSYRVHQPYTWDEPKISSCLCSLNLPLRSRCFRPKHLLSNLTQLLRSRCIRPTPPLQFLNSLFFSFNVMNLFLSFLF